MSGDKIASIDKLSASHNPDDLVKLTNFLLDEAELVRKAALAGLARINREALLESFPLVEERLKPYVAKLLHQFDSGLADKLARDLQHMDSQRRVRAIDLMVRLGKKDGVREALKNVLKDTDSRVRASAIAAIGLLGDSQDMSDLISMIDDQDIRVKANIIEALEKIGDDSVIWFLLRFASDVNNRVRANALKALWKFGYQDIEQQLAAMLKDENEWMRASACWVVGEIRDQQLAGLLGLSARDQSPSVRINAARAFAKIGTPACLKRLEEMQDDPSLEVRAAVINLLTRIS